MMILPQLLLGTLTLTVPGFGYPAKGKPWLLLIEDKARCSHSTTGRRAQDPAELHDIDEELTVYDPSVAAPTRVPGEVVWVADDDGSPALTTTEMIMVLPATPSATPDATTPKDGPTTTTTMTSMSTETLLISVPMGGATSPTAAVVAAPGGPIPVKGPSGQGAASSSSGNGSDTSDGANSLGISYAPYRADHNCKSAEDIMDDFQRFVGDYSLVRIYGTDCDQVPNVYSAAKKAGVKVMMGIWDIHSVGNEAAKIVEGIDGDWDVVHSVSVGNELVNNGQATPQQVTDAVGQARQALRKAGYNGPVVAVDTFLAVESHPELCEQSDFCAINAHPFFDSTVDAADAGKWLQSTLQQVRSALSKPMQVVVTETGWPTEGAANGQAIPGLANQKTAIKSIDNAFSHYPSDVILFSAFDDLWKAKTMTTFNADQHWGIGGAIANCDLALI